MLSNREGCTSDALKIQTVDGVTVTTAPLKVMTFKFKSCVQCLKRSCLVSIHSCRSRFIDIYGEAGLERHFLRQTFDIELTVTLSHLHLIKICLKSQ